MESRQGRPSDRKKRAAGTEAALKAAARRTFVERGYLNTKITDITAAAGRSAGSFYLHFAGKEQLLDALLADFQAKLDSEIVRGTPGRDLSKPAVLRAHIAVFWETFKAHVPEMIALQQAAMIDPRFALRLQKLRAPDRGEITAHLEKQRSKGVRLPGRPELVAAAISGMMWRFAYEQLADGDGSVPDDEAIDLLAALIQDGVGGCRITSR
jgi:AcrR family transcriptional regulator